MIYIIAALANDNALGFENHLLYRLPNDLKRFKALTTGHTIIMGRRTFESLPKGALPNRRNMVLSHRTINIDGAEVYPSLHDALAQCPESEPVFVIGGASVYREALPLAQRLYITHVDDTPAQADVFFPHIDPATWTATYIEPHQPDERHAHAYTFVDYERK